MKIGLYISPAHAVPPNETNILAPWVLTQELANGLVKLGHEVHLFAAHGSKTDAILYDFAIAPTVTKQSTSTPADYHELVVSSELKLFDRMMSLVVSENIDVVHIQHPIELFADKIGVYPKIPFVFTFHDPIAVTRLLTLKHMQKFSNCYFVSISNQQRYQTHLNFSATIYNGVSLLVFNFNQTLEKYAPLLAVGRIVPKKGFADAITVARKSRQKLILAGQIYTDNPEAKAYYEKVIAPQIDGKLVFMEQFIHREHLAGHYQMAKALLFPIKWDEPFGLVMIEAMACGTPVVAYNRGSVSEIVRDGVTGFIVDPSDQQNQKLNIKNQKENCWVIKKRGVEGLVEAVKHIYAMPEEDYQRMRLNCRKHVDDKFSVDHMVNGYVNVYHKMILDNKT